MSLTENRTIIYSAISIAYLNSLFETVYGRKPEDINEYLWYNELKQKFITSYFRFKFLACLRSHLAQIFTAYVCRTIKPRCIAVFEIIITPAIKLISSALIPVKPNTKQLSVSSSLWKFILKHR